MISYGTLLRNCRERVTWCSLQSLACKCLKPDRHFFFRFRVLWRANTIAMNLCLLLLTSLAYAINTESSPNGEPGSLLAPSPLNVTYRCASSEDPIAGRQVPTALDCLNVLTFILATTPNHDRPTHWSRTPASRHTKLPYRRNSGSCQFLVRLTTTVPPTLIEIASFDQVIAAALRIVEVCILSGRADLKPSGGVGLGGRNGHLDIVVWGAPVPRGHEGSLSNETAVLNQSDASFNLTFQS